MAARYNRPGFEDLIDFNVYALCGDGCMMEGISSEAASLAAHWKLSNLCWIYDNNHITIEGNTALAFTEDVATRFLGYGWNVTRVGDANDLDLLDRAFSVFLEERERPTLIIVDSHIGWGAPHKQDTSAAHGEPLGEEEVRLTKRNYGWPEDAKFLVPDGVYEHFHEGIGRRGKELRDAWFARVERYRAEHPDLADELYRMQHRQLPDGWDKSLPSFPADRKGMATRNSSGLVLNAIAKNVPWLMGGAADLAPSTKTRLTFDGAGDFQADNYAGRNLHFGIREHAMGAILNGMALVKVRPFGSGFLIFSDYGRMPIRLAAIMEIPVIYVFTHDSIGVGEDGPTHQPIEQLASLRAIPGLDRAPPRRRQRGGRGLEGHHAAPSPAGGPHPHASGPPDARPRQICRGLRAGQGRLYPRRRAGRQARRPADGHRQRGRALRRGARTTRRRGHPVPRRQHALVGALRRPGRGLSRFSPATGTSRRGSRSSWRRSSAGRSTSGRTARASACGPSEPRPRSRTSSENSVSPSSESSRPRKPNWHG